MVSAEEILIRIRGQDQSGSAFASAQKRAGALKTAIGGAMTMASGAMLSYAKDAVDSAVTAENEWNRFGNAIEKNGGNWEKDSAAMKKWVADYSNNTGRSVADTRAAMNTYLQAGYSYSEAQQMMAATSNYAAQTGISQEEAAGKLQKALMGNGKAIKEIGLDINDYKDKTTGAIDKTRLMNDVLNRTQGASDKYADSTAGKFQRLNNVLASMKTDFGNALIDAITPLIPVVQGFLDVIKNLPGPVKTVGFAAMALGAGIGIIAGPLMSVIGLLEMMGFTLPALTGEAGLLSGALTQLGLATGVLSAEEVTLTAEEIAAAAAHASNGVAVAAEGVAADGAATSFTILSAAEWSALWPILAIAAAIAAVIIIIEQIGEAMGWWTDFGTMLDAIKAGVERLWNAFINSPQVQGAIKAVQNAIQQLWNFVKPVFDWLGAAWNDLFNGEGAGSGGPDVVGQIINFFGQLGSIASQVFGILQRGFNAVAYIVTPLWNGLSQIIGVFGQLMNGSISWQDAFMKVLTIIGTAVRGFSARLAPIALQIGRTLLNGIVNTLRRIPVLLGQLLLQAVTRIGTFGNNAAIRARAAGRQILMGIVNYIRQLPGRVGSFMMQLPGRISGAAGAAVGAAMSLASQLLTAVVNGVKGIADAVFNEFMNIGNKIRDAIGNAVNNALQFGNDIKDAVLGALGIHSPGIIQRKIAIEFQDIPGRITESNGQVYTAAQSYASRIMNGFNTPPMNHANLNAYRLGANYNPTTQGNGNNTTIIIGEGAIQLDARNLTTKESKQVLINALQGLDSIKNIEVQGA